MALSLAGLNFFGTHGEIREGEWEFDVKRTKFFGVIGTSEILGGVGKRKIQTELWLYNSFSSGNAAAEAKEDLDQQIGRNGLLVESGTVARNWKYVTFDGFVAKKGPLYDPVLKWYFIGELSFTQLAPSGVT